MKKKEQIKAAITNYMMQKQMDLDRFVVHADLKPFPLPQTNFYKNQLAHVADLVENGAATLEEAELGLAIRMVHTFASAGRIAELSKTIRNNYPEYGLSDKEAGVTITSEAFERFEKSEGF